MSECQYCGEQLQKATVCDPCHDAIVEMWSAKFARANEIITMLPHAPDCPAAEGKWGKCQCGKEEVL